jgi:iron complex transport system permease protein
MATMPTRTRTWRLVRLPLVRLTVRIDRRAPAALLALGLLTAGAMVINMGRGEYPVSPMDVVRALLGIDTGNPDQAFIVTTLRLPRMLVALLVGMALGISGAVLQGLLRNPLASPDVLGITPGASLAAVTLIVLVPNAPVSALPVAAFLGAASAAVVVYLVARTGRGGPLRMILVGVGVAAVAYALTTAIIAFGRIFAVSTAIVWLAGSVYGRTWEHLWPLIPWVAILLPVTWIGARHLDALGLGDDVAVALGGRVELARGALLFVSVGLAGAAVATAGAVGFVGLMAPHIARQLVGPSHAGMLLTAALTGGLLVVGADLIGRTFFAPVEVPCGIITATLGAPFFIVLLHRGRNVTG